MADCTYIDGVGSSQAIDTAGEIVDLLGLDCSSLLGAALNWEHKSDTPSQIVGKILEFKKIFSAKDCKTDRQKYFWDKCQLPFLYILGRLFDDKKDSSKEVAALFKDDAEHPNEAKMVSFSVEGAKIDKKGMTITRSIARKVTITSIPANKTCLAEMVPKSENSKDDIDSLFKGEIEFFQPSSKHIEFLQKQENIENLEKSEPGWSKPKFEDGAVHFSHPKHGTISIHKQPNGEFHVKHQGGMAALGNISGNFKDPKAAGSHAVNYMQHLNRDNISNKSELNKALDAGSGLAAPSQLVGGAVLAKEKIGKKSKWLSQAESAYQSWGKKEDFRTFMKKNMPHLAAGEIDAIGQVLALQKSIKAEGKLEKILSSYYGKAEKDLDKTTDIMMASENWELNPNSPNIHTKKYSSGHTAEIHHGFPGLFGGSRVTINGSHNYDIHGSIDKVKSHTDKLVQENKHSK